MFDFNNFVPTKHSPNNRQFSEFLVTLSGFLLTKKWFYLLKMLHFFREPETPLDSGITSRRRWLSFHAFSVKKSQNMTLFVVFVDRKLEDFFSKTMNFRSKIGFKFPGNQLF